MKGAAGVIAESLRDELMSVAGVASAEVDTDGETPIGVKVRLLPEADAAQVGLEVQRVLASHGMRSRVASEHPEPAPVISLPPQPAVPPPRPVTPPPLPEPVAAEAEVPAPAAAAATPQPPTPPAMSDAVPVLGSLAFEEAADGVTVTAVATDGRRFSRRAAAISDQAVTEAVVAAVGALAKGTPQRLLWVTSAVVEDTEVVTVLVEKTDGERVAGAAVVRAAKAYAVARATWAALRG